MRIRHGLPSHETEREILRMRAVPTRCIARAGRECQRCLSMQHAVAQIKVDSSLHDYALKIVRRTRKSEQLSLGVSPRGTLMLQRPRKPALSSMAATSVLPDDFKQLAVSLSRIAWWPARAMLRSRKNQRPPKRFSANRRIRSRSLVTRVP